MVATMILFIIAAVVASNSDNPGLPEVYSTSHHMHAGRKLIDAFVPSAPALEPAAPDTVVCGPSSATASQSCGLHWCEAPKEGADACSGVSCPTTKNATPEPPSTHESCTCQYTTPADCDRVCQIKWANPSTLLNGCDYINLTSTIMGTSFFQANDSARLLSLNGVLQASFPSVNTTMSILGSQGKVRSSLVLEHWESGLTSVEPVVEMPAAFIKTSAINAKSVTSNTCQVPLTCYCGKRMCSDPAGQKLIQIQKMTVPKAAVTGRRLSQTVQPIPSVKEVVIVYGITSGKDDFFEGVGKGTWSFDKTFEPVSPWAQRAMLKMCTNIPADFGVLESHCWVEQFRTWMLSQGQRFPTQRFSDFQAHLRRFLTAQPSTPITAMWMDANGDMRATAFAFMVPPKLKASSEEQLKERTKWVAYVRAENEEAAASASGAWATSSSWANAEAQYEAMTNAWEVAFLSIAICILACILYTWDGVFVTIVFVTTTIALIFMSFFMFCIFQWAIGPWEVILLVAFLMYTIEPALRIGRGTIWGEWFSMETKLAGNAVTPLEGLQNPRLPHAASGISITDVSGEESAIIAPSLPVGEEGPGDDFQNPDAPAAEGSSNNSPVDNRDEAAARSRFEGRMHMFVLNVSNATFGSALKLVLCGMLILPCEFRLFTRLGAVSIMVPILALPCTFILVPTALVLIPIREQPDLVSMWDWFWGRINASREYS